MFKGLMTTAVVLAAAVEPVVDQVDLPRYAITQGGLFMVCLVLLWYIRELHKDRADKSVKTVEALIDLVATANRTMEKNISVGEAQEKAVDRLARALEGGRH